MDPMELCKLSRFALVLAGTFLCSTALMSSDLRAQEDETEEIPAAQGATMETPPALEVLSRFRTERASFLQTLAKEVEPNLPAKDVERLRRAVQRRGSYRSDWAKSAQEFLTANAPVAELQIYKYSTFLNDRLNLRLLETLLTFENLRYPRATLAFAESLGTSPDAKVKLIRLTERALTQDPTMAADVITLIQSPWGQEVPIEERLRFVHRTCATWHKAPIFHDQLNVWASQAESFWGRLFAQEVAACLKGL